MTTHDIPFTLKSTIIKKIRICQVVSDVMIIYPCFRSSKKPALLDGENDDSIHIVINLNETSQNNRDDHLSFDQQILKQVCPNEQY